MMDSDTICEPHLNSLISSATFEQKLSDASLSREATTAYNNKQCYVVLQDFKIY